LVAQLDGIKRPEDGPYPARYISALCVLYALYLRKFDEDCAYGRETYELLDSGKTGRVAEEEADGAGSDNDDDDSPKYLGDELLRLLEPKTGKPWLSNKKGMDGFMSLVDQLLAFNDRRLSLSAFIENKLSTDPDEKVIVVFEEKLTRAQNSKGESSATDLASTGGINTGVFVSLLSAVNQLLQSEDSGATKILGPQLQHFVPVFNHALTALSEKNAKATEVVIKEGRLYHPLLDDNAKSTASSAATNEPPAKKRKVANQAGNKASPKQVTDATSSNKTKEKGSVTEDSSAATNEPPAKKRKVANQAGNKASPKQVADATSSNKTKEKGSVTEDNDKAPARHKKGAGKHTTNAASTTKNKKKPVQQTPQDGGGSPQRKSPRNSGKSTRKEPAASD
jgi:hypothetical protein